MFCRFLFSTFTLHLGRLFFISRSSADDDNSVVTTMTNGFGSPPKIDQPSASQQQQREEQQLQQCQRNASDYLSLSGTKARSNSNNVCGAPSFVAHMNEEIASVSQGSQCRVANDIIVPKTASLFDLVRLIIVRSLSVFADSVWRTSFHFDSGYVHQVLNSYHFNPLTDAPTEAKPESRRTNPFAAVVERSKS